ncbi:MAG: hypothetical protein ACODAD_01860 [Planctomycetota bacterium]
MLYRSLLLVFCFLLSGVATGQAADPPVSLELATERGFPINGHQRWMQFLQDPQLNVTHVRIRSARGGDEPTIKNRGSASSPRYTVTGLLTTDGQLALPGLVVRHGQHKELSEWLEKLRRGGVETATSPTGIFGLNAKQLDALGEALKEPVAISTKGQSIRDVLRHIRRKITVDVEIDSTASRAISDENTVFDELRGLSCGTALAAAIRPYGLLATPTGQGTRAVGIRVTKDATLKDAWPVGGRVKTGLGNLAPNLLKFIEVEIADQPLGATLDTIQNRLEIPFLYDHNALARHEVDLSEHVNLPAKKTFYKKIIDQLLFQKLLVSELRTDELGTPFLWITTAKK